MPVVTMEDVAPTSKKPTVYQQPLTTAHDLPVEVAWLRASAQCVLALPKERLAQHVGAVARIGDELADLVELVTDEMGTGQ